jgi:leader peptidase (prepilin peptidase)/N-methyltransferase
MPSTLVYILAALLGLSIGSFLNVAIYRLPREKLRVRSGRSRCPSCDTVLKWYHNIPVISYVFLRGKCAFCSAPISWRYPAVELLNCGFYLCLIWQFGLTWQFAVYAYIASVLLAVFFIDLDFQIIPDVITLPGIVLGLGASLLPGGIGIVQSGIGLLVGGGSLYLVAMLGDYLFKKESMGGGDIKLAAMLGAFLGWEKILFVFVASAVIGLVVSAGLMLFSAKLRQHRVVPFGPFIALAAVVAMLYGDQVIRFYIETFVAAG